VAVKERGCGDYPYRITRLVNGDILHTAPNYNVARRRRFVWVGV
jgi:hypothetical protein